MSLKDLIDHRRRINAGISEFGKQWDDCNAAIVALVSPHRIGDRVPFTTGSGTTLKNFTLQVDKISVCQRMKASGGEEEPLLLHFGGTVVLKTGRLGEKRAGFTIPLPEAGEL